MGGRSLWCSYESFAINGLPIVQTVTQAMAELRRSLPQLLPLFTAGALGKDATVGLTSVLKLRAILPP